MFHFDLFVYFQPIGSESLEDDGEHGGLVKKILETKKELEGNKMNNKKDVS